MEKYLKIIDESVNEAANEVKKEIILEYLLQNIDTPKTAGSVLGTALGAGIPSVIGLLTLRKLKKQLKKAKSPEEREEILKKISQVIGGTALAATAGGVGGYFGGKYLGGKVPPEYKPSDIIPDKLASKKLMLNRFARDTEAQTKKLKDVLDSKEPRTLRGKLEKRRLNAIIKANEKLASVYNQDPEKFEDLIFNTASMTKDDVVSERERLKELMKQNIHKALNLK